MVIWQHILTFALAAVLIVIVPGPNMTFLISTAATYGRRTAILALLGSNTALLTLGILTGLGLSSLLRAVPIVYDVLRISGAFYFFWLAFKSVANRDPANQPGKVMSKFSDTRAYRSGFITNILNPKAAAFYIAIFPQFFIPKMGFIVVQGAALAMIHASISFTINSIIIISVHGMARHVKKSEKTQLAKRWATALVFTAFGIKMLMQKAR